MRTTQNAFLAGRNAAAKPCDYCKSAAALLFCRTDSAFMCISCDSKAHVPGDVVKHERVWLCEVCGQFPAAVTCKADAAALCFTCDRDIHSANPLARRHQRFPVVPFYESAESMAMKSAAAADGDRQFNRSADLYGMTGCATDCSLISNDRVMTNKVSLDIADMKSIEFLFSDSDQFLEFDDYQICSQPYSDSVVPVQTTVKPPKSHGQHSPKTRFEIDFTRSDVAASYNNIYATASLSHSVSSSSIDVGVVPDGTTMSESSSFPFGGTTNSSIDLTSTNQASPKVVAMDREARVLRYREKRKNRKFGKTIRYASRKAYAEARPRIKGRFVKRTDSHGESDVDGFFAGNFFADERYGVVPSF